jgi:hypothetical protein
MTDGFDNINLFHKSNNEIMDKPYCFLQLMVEIWKGAAHYAEK